MIKKIPVQSGHFKSFDDYPIYYEVRGEGEPVVFIYGIACLINHWHHQLDYFSNNYQAISYDLRGHHKSFNGNKKADFSLAALAKDLPCMLRELGIKQAHFVVHSFGGQIALRAYEEFPEIFKSLTLVNGFASNPLKGMFGLNLAEPLFKVVKEIHSLSPNEISKLWKGAIDNPISMWLSGIMGGFNLKLTDFKDIEIYVKGVSNISLDVLIPFFEDMIRFDGTQSAKKINIPTLIISGDRDLVTPIKFQYNLHKIIKNSELFIVPYGSHCTQLDFPEYTNFKIDNFIKKGSH
jgi:pimeloyl-ACP methyl ester carboxylesterase